MPSLARPGLALLAAGAALSVAACTAAAPAEHVNRLTGRQENTPAEARVEFAREAAHLALPGGVRWPAQPVNTSGPDGAPVRYQPGYGTQAADGYWLCAWEGVAATALPATRRRQVAATMTAVRRTYLYSTSLDGPGRNYVDGILAAAGRDTHRSELAADVARNCPVVERADGAGA